MNSDLCDILILQKNQFCLLNNKICKSDFSNVLVEAKNPLTKSKQFECIKCGKQSLFVYNHLSGTICSVCFFLNYKDILSCAYCNKFYDCITCGGKSSN